MVLDATAYMEPHWESLYDTCVSPALSYLDMQRPPQRSTDFRVEYALVCFYEHAPYGNRLLKTNNFTPKLTARPQPTRAPASAAATPAAPAHAARTPMHAPTSPPASARRGAAPPQVFDAWSRGVSFEGGGYAQNAVSEGVAAGSPPPPPPPLRIAPTPPPPPPPSAAVCPGVDRNRYSGPCIEPLGLSLVPLGFGILPG